MNYPKGLQILMMAVLLVSTAVLSAGVQELVSNPAWPQWKALQEQFAARYQAGDYAGAEQLARQALAVRSVLSVLSIPPPPSVSITWLYCCRTRAAMGRPGR